MRIEELAGFVNHFFTVDSSEAFVSALLTWRYLPAGGRTKIANAGGS
jgi:hypothetical protein